MTDLNGLTGKVIGAAIEAHKGITLSPAEGLRPFARLGPARHQLRFRPALLPSRERLTGAGRRVSQSGEKTYTLCDLCASSERSERVVNIKGGNDAAR